MSQSTESTPEANPFTKPGFIIAAALVVALLAGARFAREELGVELPASVPA